MAALPKKQKEMVCWEKGCGGTVDVSTPLTVQVEFWSLGKAFPCGKCGRLHGRSGSPVVTRRGQAAYWDNGVVRLEEIGPDENLLLFPFSIHLDESWLGGLLINLVLALFKSRKRARLIEREGGIYATGVWTPSEVAAVVQQMIRGKDHYPKTKRGLRRLFQYLGVTD